LLLIAVICGSTFLTLFTIATINSFTSLGFPALLTLIVGLPFQLVVLTFCLTLLAPLLIALAVLIIAMITTLIFSSLLSALTSITLTVAITVLLLSRAPFRFFLLL
tara:strand:- start:145 stop:462 length:318 start_codon:yes stop_codon:yes gene_type:complete